MTYQRHNKSNSYDFIYSALSDKEEAEKTAEELIRQKLAACVNIFPADSVYFEEGKIKKTKEAAAIIKTRKINFKKVEKFISKNHSYKVPCIAGIPVRKVNKKYFHWLKETLK
ncbi:MAG: divalent-cation tolerance protein CutA [Patescibacteria group bacterium]